MLLQRAIALLLQCCCCSALRRCCYNDTIVATRCGAPATEIFVFFLFDSFRRENESEKEKKE
jgi:hypothetical protein